MKSIIIAAKLILSIIEIVVTTKLNRKNLRVLSTRNVRNTLLPLTKNKKMQLRKSIQTLIESNKFTDALNLIGLHAEQSKDKNLETIVTILKARFNNLKSREWSGILGHEEKEILANSIRASILELNNTIDEPKIIEQKVQDELNKVNIKIEEKKETISFFSWIKSNLMDGNILLPFFLVLGSLFYFYRWLVNGEVQGFLYCGVITNLLISIFYLLRPIRKHIKKRSKDTEIIFSEFEKEKLKLLLDIETDYGLKNAYSRALNELKRFDRCWYFVWIGWAGLYFYWVIALLILPSIPSRISVLLLESIYFQALQPILNGISSLFILFSFLILYFKKEDIKNNIKWRFIFTALFGISLLVLFNSNNVENMTVKYDIVSGIFAGIAIALLSGRLDSKFLAIPFWIIVALYFYALIQYSIVDFGNDIFKSINVNLALFAKSLLMILFAWLTATNRLLYYIIVANKKEDDVAANMDSIVKYL